MKHLKEYNHFLIQEELNWDNIKKRWSNFLHGKPNDYDQIADSIFNRISSLFEYDRLLMRSRSEGDVKKWYNRIYTYRLEETDSTHGYIEVEVIPYYDYVDEEGNHYDVSLYVDNEKFECGDDRTSHKFYDFFDKKWDEKKDLEKQKKIDNLKKKYI